MCERERVCVCVWVWVDERERETYQASLRKGDAGGGVSSGMHERCSTRG